jgi:beta-glucanase (GH16 family)
MKSEVYPSIASAAVAAALLLDATGAVAITCPAPAAAPAVTAPYVVGETVTGYTPSFADEFNGSALDASKWNNAIWYSTSKGPTNYAVSGGQLLIWPQPQGTKFYDRTIDTDNKFAQQYGYFEICAKLPKGIGPWPAFWLLNHQTAARPEIDIMEAYPGSTNIGYWANASHEPIRYGTTVWYDITQLAGAVNPGTYSPLNQSFNVYGAKWEPSGITFYFNGYQVGQIGTSPAMSLPMYVLLSLWYGSESGTPSLKNTPTGKTNAYAIDYIRVWKLPAQ